MTPDEELAVGITIVACSLQPAGADDVLSGLSSRLHRWSGEEVTRLRSSDSGQRKGRAAAFFGTVAGVDARIKALQGTLSPALRREVLRHLPGYLRRLLSATESGPSRHSPALSAVGSGIARAVVASKFET
jgi:hypothetical protein